MILLAGALLAGTVPLLGQGATPEEILAVDPDTTSVPSRPAALATDLTVFFSDGRAPRRERLARLEDGVYARLGPLVWDLSATLAWDPLALRGELTWDSLGVALAAGCGVIHQGGRAFTLRRPVVYSRGGLLYPYPELLDALEKIDTRIVRIGDTLLVVSGEPRMRSLSQREVGHRYELRCEMPVRPAEHVTWDGRGRLRVDLDGVWGTSVELPRPEDGEYAVLEEIRPTTRGTALILDVKRSVQGWFASWDENASVWTLVLSAGSREVRRNNMPVLAWRPLPSKVGREGPIVVEIDTRQIKENRESRYLEELGRNVADLLHGRTGVPVEVVRSRGRGPDDHAATANSRDAVLFLSLAVDRYAGAVPHGITAVVPMVERPREQIFEDDAPQQRPAGGLLTPWEDVAEQYEGLSLYVAKLLAASLPGNVATAIEERPLTDLVGLDMPAVKLYIGKQSPAWDTSPSFPSDSEWGAMDRLALSIVEAVRQYFHAGRTGEDM